MSRQAIDEPLPFRAGEMFADSETTRIDVDAATNAIQLVPVRVMEPMLPTPVGEWGESDEAAHSARHRVGAPRGKEGAVAAIVLHDEDSHQERTRGDRKGQREQIRYRKNEIHRRTTSEKWPERSDELQQSLGANRP